MSSQTSSALLRPGIVVGAYPEQADIRDGWLDRAAANFAGKLRRHVYGRRPRFGNFVRSVDRQADGLDRLSEGRLRACVLDLRRQLYGAGLKDDLVARSFAIIREIATRRLEMRHFDVQLFGGYVMLHGMVAEMETGEGKTLTATLPAATAALAGIPVHIVTVNDFLVRRDAEWMDPVYRALGLSVGEITEPPQVYRRVKLSKDEPYDTTQTYPVLYG